MAAHKCYIAMLKMDNHLQMINIEEQRTVAKPIERLEEVLLDDSKPNRTTNNEVKYEALVAGPDLAKSAGAASVVIHCDSQVVTIE